MSHRHDHHDHSHAHDHAHDHAPKHDSHGHHGHHGHHHHGDPTRQKRAFSIAIVLNTGFVLIEFAYGLIANSTALIADAGHNLSDVLGLALALGASLLAKRAPSERFTYGLRSSSILAAMANAMLLLIACGGVAWEALQRISAPQPVAGSIVMWVAAAGILVNGFSAWLFLSGAKEDLNVRAAYMHMAADAAVSLGVVITGALMMATGWYWLDPVVSVVIVAVIVWGTWGLLREAVRLSLSAVPAGIELAEVRKFLSEQPGVADVHDLHVWGMSTTESALTAHLVLPDGHPEDAFVETVAERLKARFGIGHSTLQLERGGTAHVCPLHADAGHARGHQH
ncbi:MAG: cation transporter [Paucibacter sp.]|nr:cation transporter [Roseateles sp.]